jgi:hypothetical protein
MGSFLHTDGTDFRSAALCGLSQIGSGVAGECEAAAGESVKSRHCRLHLFGCCLISPKFSRPLYPEETMHVLRARGFEKIL